MALSGYITIVTVDFNRPRCCRGGKGTLMNIAELIPTGRDKAIPRERLKRKSGYTDRDMREAIELARRHTVIINLSDGKGYFKPDPNNKEDVLLAVRYAAQEESRKRSLEQSLSTVYDFLAKAVAD